MRRLMNVNGVCASGGRAAGLADGLSGGGSHPGWKPVQAFLQGCQGYNQRQYKALR